MGRGAVEAKRGSHAAVLRWLAAVGICHVFRALKTWSCLCHRVAVPAAEPAAAPCMSGGVVNFTLLRRWTTSLTSLAPRMRVRAAGRHTGASVHASATTCMPLLLARHAGVNQLPWSAFACDASPHANRPHSLQRVSLLRALMECCRRRHGRRGAGCCGNQRAARARRLGDLLHPHCVSLARCLVVLGMCWFGSWHLKQLACGRFCCRSAAAAAHVAAPTLFPTANPCPPCSCPQLPPLPERGCAVCGAAACQCGRRRPGGHF